MKTYGLLARNRLNGELVDALHAAMCGAGHNLRLIQACLRALYCTLVVVLVELADGLARGLRGSIDSPRRLVT